ncbi:polysaccharide lyase family 1 protein [Ralstonia sp. A12]|uniref:polysaccharide lyase family 1 protein n=1 Tax=Ralstonia sp. A12 TaxID=1217052 RepID=UPI001E65D51F|nr:polysaccharide lyase family 1 protein [Ralstonia sp. A12]
MFVNKKSLKAATLALGCLALFSAAQVSQASDNPMASMPEGFGAGTTGGAGGEVVVVNDPIKGREQLKNALCGSYDGTGACNDTTPRVIQIATTIDYTGTEGKSHRAGCYPGNVCAAPYKTEALVLLNSSDTHCTGKSVTQITYDTAGNNPLMVGSNKTVIGVGTTGILKGKGLRLNEVSNVVIRNLTISDINHGVIFVGDGISLEHVDHVWVDHNRFHNIGRQMVVDHFGPTSNVTISWNDFDGNDVYSPACNGKHYWNVLMDASEQTVTFSNNWFHEFSGREPKILGNQAVVHLVNNYFQDGAWHALDAREQSTVLVEGNYFDNVSVPILPDNGYVFGAQGGPNAATQAQCKATFGRNCLGNVVQPASVTSGFTQDSIVMHAFKSVDKSKIVVPYKASAVPEAVKAHAGPGHI